MAKHRKDGTEHDIEGNLFESEYTQGELKEQLTDKPEPGEGVGDSSTSPIDTW